MIEMVVEKVSPKAVLVAKVLQCIVDAKRATTADYVMVLGPTYELVLECKKEE